MICPKCRFEQPDQTIECAKCGIIFSKYRPDKQSSAKTSETEKPEDNHAEEIVWKEYQSIGDLFFTPPAESNRLILGGRVIVFLLIAVWSFKFIFTPMPANYAGRCILHYVNLPFHEAGHILFMPFGHFISKLGGTLGQLLMPLICCIVFLIKTRDPFGGSVTTWWLGESLMDIAPYINDARALKMTLLGGVTGRETVDYHDWEFILRKMGWLRYDHTLAYTAHYIGAVFMILSISWGGFLLYRMYRDRE